MTDYEPCPDCERLQDWLDKANSNASILEGQIASLEAENAELRVLLDQTLPWLRDSAIEWRSFSEGPGSIEIRQAERLEKLIQDIAHGMIDEKDCVYK